MPKSVEILCPKCDWKPDGKAWWVCTCGHRWNTFETAARCPSCKKQWEKTQCPTPAGGCGTESPHLDWYRGLDDWLVEELEQLTILLPA
ncbi:MAG: hypothetical protein RIC19_24940 [Phaeodactylibacter sp.]|uniref:hypothetical protein n=1 Tax=Phaeodactylibacter sp. TaxID=1940289 RepID=UPI0032EF5661